MSSQESPPDPATTSPSPTAPILTNDPPPTTSDSSPTTATTTTDDPPKISTPAESSNPPETWDQTITKQTPSDPPTIVTATTATTTTTTTPYTTHYVTTIAFVTITTMIPQPTIISGSVTTVYSLGTTIYMKPTIIPDPSQSPPPPPPPPPPPTIYGYLPDRDHHGLQTWQLTLIIVAALVILSACTSVFLVGWMRKQRREKREEEKRDDDLLPVGLEPWNDSATAAAVMGSPRRTTVNTVGIGHDGSRWPEYHEGTAGTGNYDVNGGMGTVGYPLSQLHNEDENVNYPGHNIDNNGDHYMGTYYHPTHPQHDFGNNLQENYKVPYQSDYNNNSDSALERGSSQPQYLQQLQPVVYYPKPPTGASGSYSHPNPNENGSSSMGAPQSPQGGSLLMDIGAGYADGHGSGGRLYTLGQFPQGATETVEYQTPLSPQESHMFFCAEYMDERDRTVAASPVPSSCLDVSMDKERSVEMQGKMNTEVYRKPSQMKLSRQEQVQGTENNGEHDGQNVEHEQKTRLIVSTATAVEQEGTSICGRNISSSSLASSSDHTSATFGEGGVKVRGYLNSLRDNEGDDKIAQGSASN